VRAFADVLTPVHFSATAGSDRAGLGGRLSASEAIRIVAAVPDLPDVQVNLVRDGQRIASAVRELHYDAATPGRYRIEAFIAGQRFPWIVTNAIDVGEAAPLPQRDAEPRVLPAPASLTGSQWQVEKDRSSTATLEASGDAVVLRYNLGPGNPAGQYVAIAAPAGADPVERIEFTAASAAPMRISFQVRAPGGPDGRRWRRSLYLDQASRSFAVRLSELDPVERGSLLRPVIARLQSVLIVVDTVNARPGASGEVRISNVRIVRGSAGDATSR